MLDLGLAIDVIQTLGWIRNRCFLFSLLLAARLANISLRETEVEVVNEEWVVLQRSFRLHGSATQTHHTFNPSFAIFTTYHVVLCFARLVKVFACLVLEAVL
jgi:hypothetical protein